MLERQHTIKVFCAAIERLSKPTPLSDQLPLPANHPSFKDQWIGWLKEYLSPGYYDRQNFVDDARTAYQRLNNGRMIVWLNEAAGEDDDASTRKGSGDDVGETVPIVSDDALSPRMAATRARNSRTAFS